MMRVAVLLGLIVLNGLLAMAEVALLTVRRSRLERRAEQGDGAAACALRLQLEPTRFLSTVQIGITAIGLLNGIVGEAVLARPLAAQLRLLGLAQDSSEVLATVLVVFAITYATIVLGELVPKRIGQQQAETVACLMARPLALLALLTRPFVHLLSFSTERLLRLWSRDPAEVAEALTEEDLLALLLEGSRCGLIAEREHLLLRNVFRLDERPISLLMTPRHEIVFLDAERPFDCLLDQAVAANLSRFPVCRGSLDQLEGIVTTKRLLRLYRAGQRQLPRQALQPPVYVPESLSTLNLLERFQTSGSAMLFVIDEYGALQGLITLQDVLEALAGRFPAPGQGNDSLQPLQRADGSWLLDGLMPVDEVRELLALGTLPGQERGLYQTLGGLLQVLAGHLPQLGEVLEWQDWCFEVVDLDGHRVDRVLVRRRQVPPATQPGDGAESVPAGRTTA